MTVAAPEGHRTKRRLLAQELAPQQQLTDAGGRGSNHNSRASDRSRPADDMGRRPEVPAGVGPIFSMQRDKPRESFLADIAAHDGGGVLSSGF